jgi:hypothetical protein
VLAQINLTNGFVVDDFGRRARSQYGAFADDVSVIGNAEGLTNVMVGDEYADTAFFEEADDLLISERQSGQPRKGFIGG